MIEDRSLSKAKRTLRGLGREPYSTTSQRAILKIKTCLFLLEKANREQPGGGEREPGQRPG